MDHEKAHMNPSLFRGRTLRFRKRESTYYENACKIISPAVQTSVGSILHIPEWAR